MSDASGPYAPVGQAQTLKRHPTLKPPVHRNSTPAINLSERLGTLSPGGRHPRGHHGTGKSDVRLGLVSYTQAASPLSRRRVAGSTAILRA